MSDWYWSRWSATSYQWLWSLFLCLVIFLLLKATHWPDFSPKVQKHFQIFFFFFSWCILCVFPWVRLYQQISTAGTTLGSPVSSHAQCFLCRSVSWAELSWADPSDAPLSSPFFADTHSRGDWPPRWASRSLHLNPAVSYITHIPLPPSPEQMDCNQNKDSLEEVLSQWNCFLMSQSVWWLLEISSCLNCLQIGLMMQHRKLQIPQSFV